MDKDEKLDRINRWMMLAANIGVLIGILFLIFELRQNTVASRLNSSKTFQDNFSEMGYFIAENPEFADLLERGRQGEDLNGVDKLRITVFYNNVLRTWQDAHLQVLTGTLDDKIWQGSRRRLAAVMTEDKGLYKHWQANQSEFSPAFNRMIKDALEDLAKK